MWLWKKYVNQGGWIDVGTQHKQKFHDFIFPNVLSH